jgi:adenosylmethionine-8-amino-7-oxononanoate aminotransferase
LAFEMIGAVTEDGEGNYMSALGPALLRFFAERNVLLRPLGNSIYIMPPYCITDDQLSTIYGVITEAIEYFRQPAG